MNKYLELSIIFTGTWIFLLFVALPLFPYLLDAIPVAVSEFLPFAIPEYPQFFETILTGSFYTFYYTAFFILGLAIIAGIVASWQIIVEREKMLLIALLLTIINILFLFGVIQI